MASRLVCPVRTCWDWIAVREHNEHHQREAEEECEQQRSPNGHCLLLQMHEPSTNKANFESRYNHADDNVDRSPVNPDFIESPNKDTDFIEVKIREGDRYYRKQKE